MVIVNGVTKEVAETPVTAESFAAAGKTVFEFVSAVHSGRRVVLTDKVTITDPDGIYNKFPVESKKTCCDMYEYGVPVQSALL